MEQIRNYLGVGNIYLKDNLNKAQYRVQSTKDLAKIIEHFDQYPLITQKLADYQLFKEAYYLVLDKEHLTLSGLQKIVAIKSLMNLSLSDELKAAFPNTSNGFQIKRPLVLDKTVTDPYGLSGFISGEGCFYVGLAKSATNKLQEGVQLEMQITQHSRDELLIRSLRNFFGCGTVSAKRGTNVYRYRVSKFLDLTDKVIPFLNKYPILGVKSRDYDDFCHVVSIMKLKQHLTREGLEQIRDIKAGMKTGR